MRVEEIRGMVSAYRGYDNRVRLIDAVKDASNCYDAFEWDYLPVITRDGVKELYKGSVVKMNGTVIHRYDYDARYRVF